MTGFDIKTTEYQDLSYLLMSRPKGNDLGTLCVGGLSPDLLCDSLPSLCSTGDTNVARVHISLGHAPCICEFCATIGLIKTCTSVLTATLWVMRPWVPSTDNPGTSNNTCSDEFLTLLELLLQSERPPRCAIGLARKPRPNHTTGDIFCAKLG